MLATTDDGAAGTITRLAARAAAIALVTHSYRLDVTDRAATVREIDDIEALVRMLPVFRLAYPRRFAELAAVRRAILDHLRTL